MKMVIQIAQRNPYSIYCDNCNEVKHLLERVRHVSSDKGADTCIDVTVNVLRELIDIRDQINICDIMSEKEVEEMIEFLCIS